MMDGVRNWVLTIGIKEFYITKDEANYYLASIEKGAKYVAIRDMVLSANFQSLTTKQQLEDTKKLNQGMWQCKHGDWAEFDCDVMVHGDVECHKTNNHILSPYLPQTKEGLDLLPE